MIRLISYEQSEFETKELFKFCLIRKEKALRFSRWENLVK